MPTVEQIRNARSHPNVIAFEHVIREGESDHTERAYRRVNGAPDVTSFAAHPYAGMRSPPGRASGAAQWLATTWGDLERRYPADMPDFSPPSQFFAYVAKLADRGALGDVLAGNVDAAIAKLGAEWVSLPGGSENSGRYTLERARAVFVQWGGRLAGGAAQAPDTQSPAPIDDRSTVYTPPAGSGRIHNPEQEGPEIMDPISLGFAAVSLVRSLAEAFSPLAREKLVGALDRHTSNPAVAQQIADNVLTAVKSATAQADPVIAVAQAKQDPIIAERVEVDSLAVLDKLAPLLDKIAAHELATWAAEDAGRDAAGVRGRADERDLAPLLAWGSLTLVAAIICGLFVIMGFQVVESPNREPSVAMLTLVGPLLGSVFAAFAAVFAYRFGTSRSSAVKDLTVEQLSRRR